MSRTFERSSVKVDGRHVSAQMIRCHQCDATDKVLSNNMAGSLPPEATTRKFAQMGWEVGRRQRDDLCPDCVAAYLARRAEKKTELTLVQNTPTAAQPRVMTRDDRRIIFAKLNDVYLDEASGYALGWSDAHVADDLSVPLEWVATIRAENFGNEAENAQSRFLNERAAEIGARLEQIDQRLALIDEERAYLVNEVASCRELLASFGGQSKAA